MVVDTTVLWEEEDLPLVFQVLVVQVEVVAAEQERAITAGLRQT